MSTVERILSREHWLPLAFLAVLSYATIVSGFSRPQALFWDENYHIASAQKYLNGVFFMEPHPPLGKLLIAAGEGLLQRNDRNDQFIDTDYATNPPEGFDFTGYRLFPVLFAWLTAGGAQGLAAGLLLATIALALPRAARLAFAAVLLMAATVLVNLAPPNPYTAATLKVWAQGHFLNFNGLTRLVSMLWPFAAIAYAFTLASRPQRGAVG